MFEKVLLVEDIDSIGHGVSMMLQKATDIKELVFSKYCDDAYLKLLRAEQEQAPFDLLITDLSFKKDHRESRITSGKQLIQKLRDQEKHLPIIVYSVEERPPVVKKLVERYRVSGYVLKGRNGIKDMISAVETVKDGKIFISPELSGILRRKEVFVLEDFDTLLLSRLSEGLTQEEIALQLKVEGISPNSLSSIEKRLNRLKEELKAKTTIQLISNAKDLGLI
ncbi:response regulator [Maribacter sp. 2307UL18-2]|uniref:response regulator n=1 Tax=Maribacter sp. 2307UL18-2 TaxID=3386274 RepID=UPI0039BC91A6